MLQIGLDPSTACRFVLGTVAPMRFISELCDPNFVLVNAFTFRLALQGTISIKFNFYHSFFENSIQSLQSKTTRT